MRLYRETARVRVRVRIARETAVYYCADVLHNYGMGMMV
jgi:hypothetical protein